ncbi:MAG: PQQ-like beta-propeller repeat protein [Planctomycetes bacterium]|nr:PQQ-like beta-propeller repeat protein [Planctomycetota bacterium]
MNKTVIIAALLTALALPVIADEKESAALNQWAQWRGPLGTGVAPHANPPLTWSEEKNVRWKTAIPGKGLSTPVIWGDRIFLTAAIAVGDALPDHGHAHGAHDNMPALYRHKFVVLAVNRRDGSILWQRTVNDERPHESTHETGSWASHSPVTDGEYVFASFGSRGVYCLDMNGELVWKKDLGNMQTLHGHGEGSSPALYGDTLIVNWDHEGGSFVVALDKRTGSERWKVLRDEVTSWSTPLVVVHEGKPQVIIAATKRVRGYDLATGDVIWECGGLATNVVASPVAADGFVYVGNSYEFRAMLAIRLSAAKGDITNTDAIVWTRDRHTPYVPSPLLYSDRAPGGDRLYFLKHYQGILTCLEAKTGKTLFGPQRLPGIGNVYASLVGAAGRVYIVSLNGTTVVLEHGREFKLLATNRLDDSFSASPAIVGNELFLRGDRSLYCIGEKAVK